MQYRFRRWQGLSLSAACVAALSAGCRSEREEDKGERVTLAQVPGPARASIERLTAGGQIDKIDKEVEKGKTIYDVEATVGGKHVEYTIADADGAVLGTEAPIEYSELPAAVRAAAEKYFGSATGLTALKGVEDGVTTYEIEGRKGGKKVEVSFDPSGKFLEEE